MLSDLLGLAVRAADAARQVPGVREAEHAVRDIERQAIHGVRGVLDWLESDLPVADSDERPAIGATPAGPDDAETIGYGPAYPRRGEGLTLAVRMLSQLMDRSLEQTRTEARYLLYVRTLAELVPDEARILAALADGTAYPVVDVVARNAMGQVKGHLIRDVSTVGRAAGVALPLQAHVYVTHLRRLGLVERHPEDPAFNDRYDLLLTEEAVRRAQADGRLGRGLTARAVRATLRISSLGADLWQDCNPPEPEPAHRPLAPQSPGTAPPTGAPPGAVPHTADAAEIIASDPVSRVNTGTRTGQ